MCGIDILEKIVNEIEKDYQNKNFFQKIFSKKEKNFIDNAKFYIRYKKNQKPLDKLENLCYNVDTENKERGKNT